MPITFFCSQNQVDNADIVLLGIPFDATSSFRPGSRFAPDHIRLYSEGIESYSPYQEADLEDLAFYDAGNIEGSVSNFTALQATVYSRVQDLIKQGKVDEIKEVMDKSVAQGMQTFDIALFKLYKENKISFDEALRNADSKNNLRLKINLSEGKGTDGAATPPPKPSQTTDKVSPKQASPTPASSLQGLSLEPIKQDTEEDDSPSGIFATNITSSK